MDISTINVGNLAEQLRRDGDSVALQVEGAHAIEALSARRNLLEAALQKIAGLTTGGPHTGAKEAAAAAFNALDEAKLIARQALHSTTPSKG